MSIHTRTARGAMFALARHSQLLERTSLTPLLCRGTRHKRPKRGVLVRLLQDIPTVGKKGAILEVPRQIMRSWYFPEQRAEYVLRPAGGFRPGDLVPGGEEELIEDSETSLPPPMAEAALKAPDLTLLLPVLQSLPTLTFSRRPISPSSPQIFGSVTGSNILQRITDEYKLPLDPAACTVTLQGQFVELGRIKGLGEATARLQIEGVGEAEVRVRVVPADEREVAAEPQKEVEPEQQTEAASPL